MRVLHIGKFFPPHRGGIETHLQTLANGISRFVDLDLVVSNDGHTTESILIDGVPLTRVGTAFRFASTPICPAMFQRMRRANADVVHIHLPNPAAVLCYLATRPAGRLVVSYHSDTVRHPVLAQAFQPILLHLLKRASAIVVASNRYVETSAVLQRYSQRTRVIPYGIPLENVNDVAPAAVREIRQRYGDRIVVAVGRLVYYKGFQHLIRAMKDIRGKLLILGDGPLRQQLESESRAAGVADRVAFLGAVENLLPYYHASDVFVLPSTCRAESFGIVQLEAMACGKPVINTEIPTGVPGVSLNAVTGLTVPPADSEALAGAINLLLDQPELRLKYGQAARCRVEQEFTAELMSHRMLQLYQDVTGLATHTNGVAHAKAVGSRSTLQRPQRSS